MKNVTPQQIQYDTQKVAAIAATSAAILTIVKLILYAFSGSLIIALSAWDSAVDTMISFINKKVIHFSRQEADDNHPYGHGKAEYIAALAQGCMIVGGGITILVAAIKNLLAINKHPDTSPDISPYISSTLFIVFACMSACITFYIRKQGKRLNSPALIADATHYSVDVATNGITAVSLFIVALTNWPWVDPLFSLFLAVYMGLGGLGLISDNIQNLMDRAVPHGLKAEVIDWIFKVDFRIEEIHKFRGRISGHKTFLDFHVSLSKNLSFEEAHEISDKIEKTIAQKFEADVVVHTDIFEGKETPGSILRPRLTYE